MKLNITLNFIHTLLALLLLFRLAEAPLVKLNKDPSKTLSKQQSFKESTGSQSTFEPTWESLDERPLPLWYDKAKIGVCVHWGVYSVPGFGSEWFWWNWVKKQPAYVKFMTKNYNPSFSYQEFAKSFTAEFFDATEWADLVNKSGARYFVFTSKHHDGYAMWPSKFCYNWNSRDTAPRKDFVNELAVALRKYPNVRFGLYYSLYEWFNPMYLADKQSNFTFNNYYRKKVSFELKDLIQVYKPEVIWSDVDPDSSEQYWKSREFLAWLYNESPVKNTVVANDRWGLGTLCKHGDFFTCTDRFNPGVLQQHKWENAMTLDKESWGYRKNMKLTEVLTVQELLRILVMTVSCGGNLLVNVGATKEGTIPLVFQERLLDMGKWLGVNGEAIYGTEPWVHQNESNGLTWYTSSEEAVYAINIGWPADDILKLKRPWDLFQSGVTGVSVLGESVEVKWEFLKDEVEVTFSGKMCFKNDWPWVLKIVGGNLNA